jgi:glycerophosphoryl diester phosphodiesterase
MHERVAMANREAHPPTPESNAQIVAFFTRFLGEPPADVIAVAHRGLLRDAPENTLPGFKACLDAHLGFEFDVRRSSDGALVCIHDDTLDRTTDGTGPVATATLDDLRALDAGSWFAPAFRGMRVPTVDEIMALIAAHPAAAGLYTVDIKVDDDQVERDLVAIAGRHGVLDRLLFIGRAIDHPDVRRRLRGADAGCHVAALASRREELPDAVAAADADWVYLRFVPTTDDVRAIRAAGRRTIVAGAAVAGPAEQPWREAVAAGVAAVLTDHPIALRRVAAVTRRSSPAAPSGSAP